MKLIGQMCSMTQSAIIASANETLLLAACHYVLANLIFQGGHHISCDHILMKHHATSPLVYYQKCVCSMITTFEELLREKGNL